MKNVYTKPVMESESFVADEFVSACWSGHCNINGRVYLDTNGNKRFDAGIDTRDYLNTACNESDSRFAITGVDNGFNEPTDFINAFVCEEKQVWDGPLSYHYEVVSSTPVYNFNGDHVATIGSITKHERPNHS